MGLATHHAAELAIKALHLARGQEAWVHVLTRLLADLPQAVEPVLLEPARVLEQLLHAYALPERPGGRPFIRALWSTA